ncbi:MAG: lytic transglycosylase domain-containing protein [Deltaproteobacteria bacterium]|nr:lytic transglycosylase domain-containing protein [Deltaproteobacteria bacterium]
MQFLKNNGYAKKAALVLGLTVFFQAAGLPLMAGAFDQDRGGVSGVLDVLRENRTGLGEVEETRLAEVILGESEKYKLDPLFVLALIKTESNFYNWSKSLNGALGLMQILPFTGKALAGELNLKWKGDETLLDPYANVKMGIHYLSSLNERFNDINASLAAYNSGPTYFASKTRDGDMVAQNYVNKVLYNYKDLRERADYY